MRRRTQSVWVGSSCPPCTAPFDWPPIAKGERALRTPDNADLTLPPLTLSSMALRLEHRRGTRFESTAAHSNSAWNAEVCTHPVSEDPKSRKCAHNREGRGCPLMRRGAGYRGALQRSRHLE